MTLFDRVFSGSGEMYAWAEKSVAEALEKHGADAAVSLPSTAYSLPCYYAVTGEKLTTLGEVKAALEGRIKEMMTRKERLHNVFQSGIATALAAEIIETMKYMDGAVPYEEPYVGHFTDAMIRELGVPLVTGDIPGVPVIINAAPSVEEAVALVKSYQAQGNFVTCVGGICDQLIEAGYNTGFNVRVTLMGKDITSAAHVVSIALRAALIFGNITPGDLPNLMKYTFERVFAFVNAFAPVDDLTVGCGAGAIAFGFPVISNDLESLKGMNVPKSLILQGDTEKFNPTSIEARDVKIKVTDIDIPVAFASAFEGEIIRRGDMQVEFDGSRVDCFELVQTKEASEVEDHKIEVIGPDFDEFEVGTKHSIGYIVEVAGRNMQSDFEPVFERKFHSYLNCIEGVMHTGQRDIMMVASVQNISEKYSTQRLRMSLTPLLTSAR